MQNPYKLCHLTFDGSTFHSQYKQKSAGEFDFDDQNLNTAKLFVKLYTCSPMPAFVHKILINGPLAQ